MNLSELTEAYGAYLNAHARAQEEYDHEELVLFEEDMEKARNAMTVRWLEQLAATVD